MVLPDELHLESLEVGAAPLVRHFLQRLDLHALFERHLPVLPGRPPALPSATVLCLLVTNLLLARQPLYALPHWATRRVPELLGLQPGQAALLNDDRLGRALDHLQRADRASLLTALVQHLVGAFAIDLSEFHQDTTTVTFSGDYGTQPDATRGGPTAAYYLRLQQGSPSRPQTTALQRYHQCRWCCAPSLQTLRR